MAEYIEREAVKKQMNATCRNCDARFDERECGRCGMEWAREIVRTVPAADVVEVVRCKDCKHYEESTGWCMKHSHFVDSNGFFCYPDESPEWKMFEEKDFCSYGEKRCDSNG